MYLLEHLILSRDMVLIVAAFVAVPLILICLWRIVGRCHVCRQRHERAVPHHSGDRLPQNPEISTATGHLQSEFLAAISQEIRTPMNTIIGLSHLCLETQLTGRQSDFIQKIHDSAKTTLRTLSDLLDLARIEAGQMDRESVDFSLDTVLQPVIAAIGLKAYEKDLEFIVDCDPGIPAGLVGDPRRLSQIVVNLCHNAIKFTEQGSVVIGVRVMSREHPSMRLEFFVEDTGIGMTGEEQEKLFQSFSQFDATISHRLSGHGFGLALSQRLIQRMDGTLRCRSHPGQGTRFSFDVSVGITSREHTNMESDTLPTDWHALNLHGGRVLVVEDNALARDVLIRHVMASHFRVAAAEGGDAAVDTLLRAQAEGDPFILMVIDLTMPEINGLTLAARIRQEGRLHSQPRIILTSSVGDEAVLTKAVRYADVHASLLKPFLPGQLLPALAKACSRVDHDTPQPIVSIDVATALERLENNEELYHSVLAKFLVNQGGAEKKIREALDADDMGTAQRLVHTLKGVSAMIGAFPLSEEARVLESAIKVRSEMAVLQPLLAEMARELAKICREVDIYLSMHKPHAFTPDVSETDNSISRRDALLRKLLQELSTYNADGESTLMDLKQVPLPDAMVSGMEKMTRQMLQYDFEGAIDTLRQYAKQLNIDLEH
ncbi:MAG: response regulator [Magnetococcales bacterium]|nr:response regulator [Magnetococcales bacterium]